MEHVPAENTLVNNSVRDGLNQAMFYSAVDRNHYYRSETATVPELQQAINSTVLISSDRNKPGGSGVIVKFEGKKYLITATHCVGNLLSHTTEEPTYLYYKNMRGEIQ